MISYRPGSCSLSLASRMCWKVCSGSTPQPKGAGVADRHDASHSGALVPDLVPSEPVAVRVQTEGDVFLDLDRVEWIHRPRVDVRLHAVLNPARFLEVIHAREDFSRHRLAGVGEHVGLSIHHPGLVRQQPNGNGNLSVLVARQVGLDVERPDRQFGDDDEQQRLRQPAAADARTRQGLDDRSTMFGVPGREG